MAKQEHWARITDRLGHDPMPRFAFHNSRDGFRRLVARIGQALRGTGAQRAVAGMEATGHYGKPLQYFLRYGVPELEIAVGLANPMHVQRQKEVMDNSPSKTDAKRTAVIDKLVRDGHFLHCLVPEGIYATLRELD
ncbi:MAG: transposase [Bacillota bacterium]